MRYFLLQLVIFVQIGCSSVAQQADIVEAQTKTKRTPVQKRNVVLKSPSQFAMRNFANGKEYDPRPTIKLTDERAGKYELSWMGYDGKKKVVVYEREDVIEAVVEARVETSTDGKFVYKYLIKNLPQSPSHFRLFNVQTISADVKTIASKDVYSGKMSWDIPRYKTGSWKAFGIVGDDSSRISPGKHVEFSLISTGQPGIAGCDVGGGKGYTIGVGEHMPQELSDLVPVNLWAKCQTIGPIDRLAQLNKSERAKYLLENLPKFLEAGWITADAAKKYEAMFRSEDIAGAFEKAKKDLAAEVITSEVYHIIEGLNQQN